MRATWPVIVGVSVVVCVVVLTIYSQRACQSQLLEQREAMLLALATHYASCGAPQSVATLELPRIHFVVYHKQKIVVDTLSRATSDVDELLSLRERVRKAARDGSRIVYGVVWDGPNTAHSSYTVAIDEANDHTVLALTPS